MNSHSWLFCGRTLRWICALLVMGAVGLQTARAQPTAPGETAKQPVAVASAVADSSNSATAPPVDVAAVWRGLQITGLVDVYLGYNTNRPPDGLTPYRNFDTRHNDASLNLAKLVVETIVDAENPIGFRADFTYGPSTDLINAAEPSRGEAWQHIQQLYGSARLPVGNGLRFDFGKFVTPFGAEVIETPGNWNYSRSLLFALAIPYYHAGLRASYPINDKLTVTGFVVNGWNDVDDRNSSKSGAVSLAFKPHEKLSINHTYMGGRETDSSGLRHLHDTVVTVTANSRLSLMFNVDVGKDSTAGVPVNWSGAAFYARFQVSDSVALVPRYEFFRDRDGFMTGRAQTLQEITLTGEYRIKRGPVLRLEYRHDNSDEPVFLNHRDRFRTGQNTVLIGAYYEIANLVPWLKSL
ncbi:MAG: outer membrane beta-barrel protein [Acidobacteriota bacterium]